MLVIADYMDQNWALSDIHPVFDEVDPQSISRF